MSNYKCPECGMINIDCGKEGYKTYIEWEYNPNQYSSLFAF